MNPMIARVATAAAALMLLSVRPADAQIRIVDRSTLDSLANPQLAAGAAAMRFTDTSIDTGTIGEEDGPQVYTYRFRNAGAGALTVTHVSTSCGCATATAVPETVEAGSEGEIRVTYRPKGHAGRFMRRIFVYTQLSETKPTAVLTLNADVMAGNDRSGEYTFRMGSLMLKRNSVSFSRGKSGSERIEVWNAGDRELTIDCRRHLLPECLKFGCEPERIAPGGRADITISYDAGAFPERLAELTVPLMLTGTGESVLQSTVKVTIAQTEN